MPHPTPAVSPADCLNCGACQLICPQVFQANRAAGFAQVVNPAGASPLTIQAAMDNCPVQCIHWLSPQL